MTQARNSNIPLETRIALMERDIEVLKLRDQDVRLWQEGINKVAYKTESLERALDSMREKMDELSDLFRDVSTGNKNMELFISKHFEELSKKVNTPAPAPKGSALIENIVKVVFLILLIAAAILGVKIPGAIG